MEEFFPTLIIFVLGLTPVLILTSRFNRTESLYLRVSYLLHVFSSVVLLFLMDYVFRESDAHGYISQGRLLAQLMSDDLFHWGPEVVKHMFQMHSELPPDLFGDPSPTASMHAATGIGMFFTGGSQYATNLLFATFSYFGKVALYLAFREHAPQVSAPRLLIASTLIPSVVFWSSGIVKETFATGGIALFTYGFGSFLAGRRTRGVVFCALGIPFIAAFKPFLLFPLSIAGSVWYLMVRTKTANPAGVPLIRPIYVVMAIVVAVGAVAALGVLFPNFAVDKIGETAASQRQFGAEAGGGSYYALGDPTERTLTQQLAIAPLALATVLGRPFIFEARNFTMAIAAIEITAMFAILIYSIYRRSWRVMWAELRNSPFMMFCASFVLLAGTAIGLATTNFGTLSRYRVPLMPFYVLVVLAQFSPRRAAGPAAEIARGVGTARATSANA